MSVRALTQCKGRCAAGYSRDAQALLLPGRGAVYREHGAPKVHARTRAAEAGREAAHDCRTPSEVPPATFKCGCHVPYRQKERRNMSDLYLQILLSYLLWLNG